MKISWPAWHITCSEVEIEGWRSCGSGYVFGWALVTFWIIKLNVISNGAEADGPTHVCTMIRRDTGICSVPASCCMKASSSSLKVHFDFGNDYALREWCWRRLGLLSLTNALFMCTVSLSVDDATNHDGTVQSITVIAVVIEMRTEPQSNHLPSTNCVKNQNNCQY